MRAIAIDAIAAAVLGSLLMTQALFGQVRAVTVTAIPGVVDAGVQWTLAWAGTDNADGIVGTPDGGVLFAQEQPGVVRKLDASDRTSLYVRDTHGAGSLSMNRSGRLFAALRTCTDPGNAGRGITAPCVEPTSIGTDLRNAAGRVYVMSAPGVQVLDKTGKSLGVIPTQGSSEVTGGARPCDICDASC